MHGPERLTWLNCNQRSYIWILGGHCVKMFGWLVHRRQSYFSTYMCLFNCQRKNKKIIYANVYRNTINDGDSQTSPLPISPEGGGKSVHRLPFGCSFFDGGSTVNRLLFLFFNLIMAYIYAVNTEQLWSTHDKVPHSCDGPKWKRQFLK